MQKKADRSVADAPAGAPSDLVKSVYRALLLLDLLALKSQGRPARDLAEELGMPQSTIHHLLNTLQFGGYVTKVGQDWRLSGTKVTDLYAAILDEADRIRPSALRALNQLADRTGETAYLAMLTGSQVRDGVQIVAVAEGKRSVRVSGIQPGQRGHEHARASGKAFLAELPEETLEEFLASGPLVRRTSETIVAPARFRKEIASIRTRGYATDMEEFLTGVCCVAKCVPSSPTSRAALALTVPADRFAEHLPEYLSELNSATALAAESG